VAVPIDTRTFSPEPLATYRLQVSATFDLDRVRALLPYLCQLGISHLYLSPCLQSDRSSPHGYAVVDPLHVDTRLGGEVAFTHLCTAARAAGMGLLLDIVPNHMAILAEQNPWWWDVLEKGPSSPYASYFDVDWEAADHRWRNKVLLPVLNDHYGRALEAGDIALHHAQGHFHLSYKDQGFPVDPASLGPLLGAVARTLACDELAFLAESFARLPSAQVVSSQAILRQRDQSVLQRWLVRLCRERRDLAQAIDDECQRLNGHPDDLDALLEQQNYRLACWRASGQELGYRRFFDITALVGLRIEQEEVFAATHARPLAWLADQRIQGLRIDHPDGLRDPHAYFTRLHSVCPQAWIVAEKILSPDERLPETWPIDGTTGYDFLHRVQGLLVDPDGETALRSLWEEVAEQPPPSFVEQARQSRILVLEELLRSERNRLVSLWVSICERHRRHRDYTRHELEQALNATIASFPQYRSYVRITPDRVPIVTKSDRCTIHQAITLARQERPDLDPELLHFLESLLTLDLPGPLEQELALRFQQLTAATMAKGVEDTAFYRDLCLLALNEVGSTPACFGISPARFHAACLDTQQNWPRTLLTTSTHDTKRGEDVRARLLLLSEIPERWAVAVRRWLHHAARYQQAAGPDRSLQYLFFQTLFGSWPISAERLIDYLRKAAREAHGATSWQQPQPAYEHALEAFTLAMLNDTDFLTDFTAFTTALIPAGRINSLAQTLLKLTAPGIPDLYQGSELWDLRLVDPDNRQPVDFSHRQVLLNQLTAATPESVLQAADTGLPKLWLLQHALHLRRLQPQAFSPAGTYRPLGIHGIRQHHLVAFLRGDTIAVVVPRLMLGWAGQGWGNTRLALPAAAWRNVLTGESWHSGRLRIETLLARFPVALLQRETPT
jgi:(1->4)-alpha-D-glucan 1-alpha-D-glucosylmutase